MSGTAHATFAPSSAPRLISCPASLRACKGEADDAGIDAVIGTVAHYIHEQCLLHGTSPHAYIGMHPVQFVPIDELTPREWKLLPYSRGLRPDDDYVFTKAEAEAVEESVLRCRELPGEHYIEQRVDISPWCPTVYARDEDGNFILDKNGEKIPVPQKGTADYFACSPGLLNVRDYKHGMGVQVYAERNYQAILYALGVINEYDWLYDFDKVVIGIHQTRLDHIDEWETTKAELLEIGEYIKERFALAMKKNAPFGPSEKACKFCKVSHKCKALADEVLEMFDFEDDATADDVRLDLEFLSLDREVEIYKKRKLFKLWIGGIEGDIATRIARDSMSVPGLKIVPGRSSRYWKDEDTVVDELSLYVEDEDDLYTPRNVISPAQAEKLLSKDDRSIVSELAAKRPGKPTIVDENDPRPRWDGGNAALADDMFDEES